MKRNSTTLFLISPGSTTFIPWVNNAPDFAAFTDPTLSVLQQAWNDFVATGEPLEIIPDPEAYFEPVAPNWMQFYDQLIMSSVYNHLLSQTVPYPSISGVMAVMGVAILTGKSDPSNPNRLAALQASIYGVLGALDAVGIPLTSDQLLEVRNLLDANGFNGIQLQ